MMRFLTWPPGLLAQPYCQLCCPTNFTEPYYNEHPAEYRSHPPTFLTQTTVDFCSDSCAAKNYHEVMLMRDFPQLFPCLSGRVLVK